MPRCQRCGKEIVFKTHPSNPDKMAPFDTDPAGEIHFATCGNRVDDRAVYDTIEQIEGACVKGYKAAFVHLASAKDGKQRIRATCGCGQAHFIRWLALVDEHRALINKEDDWHKTRRREIYGR